MSVSVQLNEEGRLNGINVTNAGDGKKRGLLSRLSGNKKGKLALISIGVLLGVTLLIFGGTSEGKTNAVDSKQAESLAAYANEVEEKLHTLCERVEGVSGVTVAVSFERGFEYVYAKDEGRGDYLVIGSGSSESAVRVTEIPPAIGGIGIVCKGGGDPAIQNKLINLISAAFGVSSNKIYITEAGR